MSTKIKFDRHSIKFRLWMYFIGIGVGILLLVWFLQIFFLNNYYEHMKTTEVNRVASSIYHAYARGDDELTESIQDLSISNDFYVMMESGGKVLLFMPEAESLVPVYQYKDQLPKLRTMLQNAPSKSSAVSFKINTGLEKYNTLAYATYLSHEAGHEVYLYIFSPLYPVTSTVEILKNQLFYVTIITLFVTFLLAVYFAERISKPIKSITQIARKMLHDWRNFVNETARHSRYFFASLRAMRRRSKIFSISTTGIISSASPMATAYSARLMLSKPKAAERKGI